MIIDINGYYGQWPYWPLRNGSEAALLSQMDRYAITCAVVSSLKGVFSDPDAGNREVLQLARAHPDRFLPALTYSPHAAGRDRYAEDFDGLPSGIVKLFPVQHTYDPLEETYIHELLTFCEIRHIPVMIPYRLMMSWRFPVFDLKKMALVIASFPAVRFIIASINYLAELQSAIHILHKHPNAYIETSAMMAFGEIESVVRQVGADRILHGTCIPLQNPAIGPLKIHNAQIGKAEKNKILFENAAGLLKLK
ncbi:MAG TPA: amidohydrolase family protein [bacterium]|nr:amidohydrolase family protein [bacterium]